MQENAFTPRARSIIAAAVVACSTLLWVDFANQLDRDTDVVLQGRARAAKAATEEAVTEGITPEAVGGDEDEGAAEVGTEPEG